MATVKLGRVRMVYEGVYIPSKTYEILSIVDHANITYWSVKAVPAGNAPDAYQSPYWKTLVVNGVAGKSAYELWLDAGNRGTMQDFLDSLKGVDGYTVPISDTLISPDSGVAASSKAAYDLNNKITTLDTKVKVIDSTVLPNIADLDTRVKANKTLAESKVSTVNGVPIDASKNVQLVHYITKMQYADMKLAGTLLPNHRYIVTDSNGLDLTL